MRLSLEVSFTYLLLSLLCLFSGPLYGQVDPCLMPDDGIGDPPITGIPTACGLHGSTVFDLTVGTSTIHPNTDGFSGTFPTAQIKIQGDFTIKSNFTINSSIVALSPGAHIYVDPSVTLTINNSTLFSCDGIWEGIILRQGANIVTQNNTLIEDAEAAIQSVNTAYNILDIENTTFNRNRIGILLENDTPSPHSPFIRTFHNNTFSCSSRITGTANEISHAGLQVTNVYRCLQKDSPDVYDNYFSDQMYGIIASGTSTDLYINDFEFSAIKQICIDFDGKDLEVKKSTFSDVYGFGIHAVEPMSITVESSFFYIDVVPFQFTDRSLWHVYIDQPLVDSELIFKDNLFSIEGIHNPGTERECIFITTTYPVGDYDLTIIDSKFTINPNAPYNNQNLNPGTALKIEGMNNGTTTVENNNFDGSNQQNYARGISWSFGNREDVDINGNVFSGHFQFGMILIGNEAGNTRITSNTFTSNMLDFLTVIPVWFDNYDNATICENTIYRSVVSYRFGAQNFGTNFTRNTTLAGFQETLVISTGNSFIGPQSHKGNTFYPLYTSSGQIFRHPIVKVSTENVAFMSRFTVHTPQSTYNSTTGQYQYLSIFHPYAVAPDSPPYTDVFFLPQLGGSPNSVCAQQAISPQPNMVDLMIADGSYSNHITSSAQVWDGERHLYYKLKHDPAYAASHPSFTIFENTHASSTVGQFYDIETAILEASKVSSSTQQQIANAKQNISVAENNMASLNLNTTNGLNSYYNGQGIIAQENSLIVGAYASHISQRNTTLSNTLTSLQQIITTNDHEKQRKLVLEALINKTLGNTISSAIVDDIKDIAKLCPESGRTIYLAREFLSRCDYLNIEDEIITCSPDYHTSGYNPALLNITSIDESFTHDDQGKNTNSIDESFLSFSPNPVRESEYFNINTSENGNLEIHDVSGRRVASYKISKGNNQLLLNLKAGTYFVSLRISDQPVEIRKIIVTN